MDRAIKAAASLDGNRPLALNARAVAQICGGGDNGMFGS